MAICHRVKDDICHAPAALDFSHDGDMARTGRPASYTEIQRQIGERILWAREIVEPNRAKFARELGLDRTTVQKIEDGDRAPSVFNVLQFSHALRVTPNYILLGAMRDIDGELAARLAAAHPELVVPRLLPEQRRQDTATASGTARQPRKRGRKAA